MLEPTVKYDSKTANYFEDCRDEMAAYVPASAQKMLEIGCGNAAFAQRLKASRQIHVTAVEAHPPAAAVASQRVDRLVQRAWDDALPELLGERFDCIVMNDVLEHLVDPWTVLTQLQGLLTKDGCVVASIPNVRYVPVLKEYLQEAQFRYRQDGVMDRTHLRFFTKKSMLDMFSATGYRVDRIDGINGVRLPWKLAMLNFVTRQAFADTQFKQFACVARLSAEAQ